MQCLDSDEAGHAPVYKQRISLQGGGLGWVVEGLSCDYAEKICGIMHYYAISVLGPDVHDTTLRYDLTAKHTKII